MATRLGLMVVYYALLVLAGARLAAPAQAPQAPLVDRGSNDSAVSPALFAELEELARIVDIAYCVGTAGLGIQKPFECVSRCAEFANFELLTAWNTGPLLSDSCGYIALSHAPSVPRIIMAFRGTYSIANTIVDLSTVPQEYVPYPGDDDDSAPSDAISPIVPPETPDVGDLPPPAQPPKCENCSVHTGFYSSWLNTRKAILPELTEAIDRYPSYRLTLVGHSLGGAVAALAGLDFLARGWHPRVTTFGEPRIGNKALMRYMNERFHATANSTAATSFHRVTHVGDPVPLLPLAEWGYSMHSEELFISAPDLPPSVADIHHCRGDDDANCIAGSGSDGSWGIPARFKFWELFFAHRDYFWRIGLCIPGGDPKGWYPKHPTARGGGAGGASQRVDEL